MQQQQFFYSHIFFDESTEVFTKEQLKDGAELFAMTQQIYQQPKDNNSLVSTNLLQAEINHSLNQQVKIRMDVVSIKRFKWYYGTIVNIRMDVDETNELLEKVLFGNAAI